MATQQSTIDYIESQLSSLPDIRSRKMFGEYCVYCQDKVIALVCDDIMFMKVTEPGLKFIPEKAGVPPYPGAKNYLPVPKDKLKNQAWLADFVQQTAAALPTKKK